MAKAAYIGINNIARKIKKGYVGVETEIPVYQDTTTTLNITASNISQAFTVTNGTYYFAGSGGIFTSNNYKVSGSTATTTLTAKSDMTVSFSYTYSSEASFDKFTLTVAGTTVVNGVSGTGSASWSGSLKAGQTIVFTYAKDGSVDRNDDECTFSSMVVKSGGKTQVGSVIKGVASKIKKAYVGVGGVARPCWSGGELAYYGSITSIPSKVRSLSGASNPKYAIFAGGLFITTAVGSVTAYNSSLTKTSATALSGYKCYVSGGSIGDYAVFAGGLDSADTAVSSVDAYNSSLVQSKPSALLYTRYGLSSAANPKYLLFAGGASDGLNEEEVFAYNSSLTRSSVSSLTYIIGINQCGASVGNYALFGSSYGGYDHVYAYNTSLTKSSPAKHSEIANYRASASNGKYALFAGGYYNGTLYNTVDAYNSSLIKTTTSLTTKKSYAIGGSSRNYALFACGSTNDWYDEAVGDVDAFNQSLVKTTTTSITARIDGASATIGDYMIFAGGRNKNGDAIATTNVYTIA